MYLQNSDTYKVKSLVLSGIRDSGCIYASLQFFSEETKPPPRLRPHVRRTGLWDADRVAGRCPRPDGYLRFLGNPNDHNHHHAGRVLPWLPELPATWLHRVAHCSRHRCRAARGDSAHRRSVLRGHRGSRLPAGSSRRRRWTRCIPGHSRPWCSPPDRKLH